MLFCFINSLTIGLIIALSVSLAIPYLNHNIGTLVAYLVIIVLSFISLFLTPYIVLKRESIGYKAIVGSLILNPLKDNLIPIILTLALGLAFAFVLPLFGLFDLFSSLIYTLCVFVFYNFAQDVFYKRINSTTLKAINFQFTMLLRNISAEVPHE